MGTWIELTATDGHRFGAYHAVALGVRRAGLVVAQEIFGANRHMRKVADGFAAQGYETILPALFDRAERRVELGYTDADVARGRDLRAAIALDAVLADVTACLDHVRAGGKVGVVGYCWGGSLAWLAATRLRADAAVGYYGGMIAAHASERPRCPVMLHFGERDSGIPIADVATVRAAHPEAPVHLYPAGHGFSCDERASYDAASAGLARERTMTFLAEHIG